MIDDNTPQLSATAKVLMQQPLLYLAVGTTGYLLLRVTSGHSTARPRRSPGLLSAKLHTKFFKSGTYFCVRTDVTKACFPVLGVAQLPPMQHLGKG
jgi:hypothetical protein